MFWPERRFLKASYSAVFIGIGLLDADLRALIADCANHNELFTGAAFCGISA